MTMQQAQSGNLHLTKAQWSVPFNAFGMRVNAELSVGPQCSYPFTLHSNELFEIKNTLNMSWFNTSELNYTHTVMHLLACQP